MTYRVGNVPAKAEALAEFLRVELQRIAAELETAQSLTLPTLYAAPSRIYEGMVVKADGTTWNPGAGAGVYARVGGAWTKL